MKGNNIFTRVRNVMFSKEYRKITYFIFFIAIIFIPISFPVSLFLIFAYMAFIDSQLHIKLMKDYAEKHGFTYSKNLNEKELPARIFQLGHSRRAGNVISGNYKKFPFRLFNYSYTVGSGKNSHTHTFTICEVLVENIDFPHIFLKSDFMQRHGIQNVFGQDKDVRIKLDKEIEKTFNLYCTQDYEIEVLQIFTDEILQILKDKGSKISIEFAKDRIYFYDDYCMRNEDDINNLLMLIKKVLDSSGELIRRLADDFESMHKVYRK